MKYINTITALRSYDTAINVIGGLKDCSILTIAIQSHFSQIDSLDQFMNQRNEFNLRTERSRTRIEREIKKGFLQFLNQDHEDLIRGIFNERVPLQDKQLFLIWQFALTNRLFREITIEMFIKTYRAGQVSIKKEDIVAYLNEFIRKNEEMQLKWSQNTIETLATKYLNFMSKLGMVSIGRMKKFNYIRPSSEAQVVFLYFAKLYSPSLNNILANELLPLSFIPSEDFLERQKRLSLKDFFNMNFNGMDLNIELIHSYRGVCDVLYY